jgi:hypothetical protein
MFGRFLCWFGIHLWDVEYVDDGKGNEGGALTCCRCGKVEMELWL